MPATPGVDQGKYRRLRAHGASHREALAMASGHSDFGSPAATSVFALNGTADAIVPVDPADSWVVGSDRMDRDTLDSTKDTRAFFSKVKGAFRAGRASGGQWDSTVVGFNSFAAGENTQARGTGSFAEGVSTLATGTAAHAEGLSSTASGDYAHAEGESTRALGQAAHAEGAGADATGDFSHAQGNAALASRYGQHAKASGWFAIKGDAQAGNLVLRRVSTDATAGELTATGAAATLTGSGTNVLTVSASRALQLKVSAVARRTDVQGEMAGWTWEGLVGRDATGNARIIGTPILAAWGDAPATDPWDVAVSINTADATNNYVQVTATGEAAKTIRWVAKLEWVEVAS